jgi:hypothetical protein
MPVRTPSPWYRPNCLHDKKRAACEVLSLISSGRSRLMQRRFLNIVVFAAIGLALVLTAHAQYSDVDDYHEGVELQKAGSPTIGRSVPTPAQACKRQSRRP